MLSRSGWIPLLRYSGASAWAGCELGTPVLNAMSAKSYPPSVTVTGYTAPAFRADQMWFFRRGGRSSSSMAASGMDTTAISAGFRRAGSISGVRSSTRIERATGAFVAPSAGEAGQRS